MRSSRGEAGLSLLPEEREARGASHERDLFRQFHDLLRLAEADGDVLLALSIILIFWATLAQVDLGVWGVHQKFFHSFFVLEKIPGTEIPVPVFPGGYFIGGLLLINLLAAHLSRFRLTWRKLGIWLTHSGLILLLVGELLSGLWQEDYDLTLDNGETGTIPRASATTNSR